MGEVSMKIAKSLVGISVASAFMAMSGNASASAFALIEQSSGLGNAFAGGAAAAEDATTIFFNPAGMSRLKGKQVTVAGSVISPSAKYSGTVAGFSGLQTGGTVMGGDAGSPALVPNIYMVAELAPALHAGLGINSPFGLKTEYDTNWVGRFQGIKSSLQTIDVNPSLSYEVTDSVSLGIGLNYQHIKGELTSATNYSAAAYQAALSPSTPSAYVPALTALAGAKSEGISTLTGSDSAWGYNLGALFNINPQTRIGAAYRSKIKYNLDGTVTFANRPALLAAGLPDQSVTLAINMPDSLAFSAFHQLDDKWDLMADATRTGWSSFKELNVMKANGTSLSNTPENWKDTWRVSVGATHHYNEQWLARVGVAYDQSPVPDAYRTVRIPDADRTWLALGGQYKLSNQSKVDFGYAHLFVKTATMNQSAAANPDLAGKGYLTGSYSSSVDILSMQYAYNF
jgi:long-chain fatty acid transport protein